MLKMVLFLPLVLFVTCGIPGQQSYPVVPTVSPGNSKVTGGELSFDGLQGHSYHLRYKIYPWSGDGVVADLVQKDIKYFEDNSIRAPDAIERRDFRPVRFSAVRNSRFENENVGNATVVINSDYSSYVRVKVGAGAPMELARDVFLDNRGRYKSYFAEYRTGDSDVASRWADFKGGDFALLFLVQSSQVDGKLLQRLYSFPVVVGYLIIRGKFNNNG